MHALSQPMMPLKQGLHIGCLDVGTRHFMLVKFRSINSIIVETYFYYQKERW